MHCSRRHSLLTFTSQQRFNRDLVPSVLAFTTLPVQASKKGMGYPKEMFITQQWYEYGWWAGSDCPDQDMVRVINYTFAISLQSLNGEDTASVQRVNLSMQCAHAPTFSTLAVLWNSYMLAVFLTQFFSPFSSYAYDAVLGARIAIHNCTSHKDSSNGSLPIATDCIANELSHINVTGETVCYFAIYYISNYFFAITIGQKRIAIIGEAVF